MTQFQRMKSAIWFELCLSKFGFKKKVKYSIRVLSRNFRLQRGLLDINSPKKSNIKLKWSYVSTYIQKWSTEYSSTKVKVSTKSGYLTNEDKFLNLYLLVYSLIVIYLFFKWTSLLNLKKVECPWSPCRSLDTGYRVYFFNTKQFFLTGYVPLELASDWDLLSPVHFKNKF
jgi:hypothetical protein